MNIDAMNQQILNLGGRIEGEDNEIAKQKMLSEMLMGKGQLRPQQGRKDVTMPIGMLEGISGIANSFMGARAARQGQEAVARRSDDRQLQMRILADMLRQAEQRAPNQEPVGPGLMPPKQPSGMGMY